VSRDLEPFADGLDEMFVKLGLPDPRVMSAILQDWVDLAGAPWAGHSRPVVVRGKTLVVEANAPSRVAFLKYGIKGLLEALAARFGEGVITGVEVVPPRRR
jgi:predicted nucleic acid-binding Zn ribbon protein